MPFSSCILMCIILGVLAVPTTGAFLSGCFVMEKMTAGTVLMNSQSTVQNAMRMETSSARINVVYQSKLPVLMKIPYKFSSLYMAAL